MASADARPDMGVDRTAGLPWSRHSPRYKTVSSASAGEAAVAADALGAGLVAAMLTRRPPRPPTALGGPSPPA